MYKLESMIAGNHQQKKLAVTIMDPPGADLTDIITDRDILLVSKNRRTVLVFGTTHIRDPNHRQYRNLTRTFIAFSPQLVLVEGGVSPNIHSSLDGAIRKEGERGCVQYLAKKARIKVLSADPSDQHLFAFLEKKYSRNDILLFFILRDFVQFVRYYVQEYKRKPTGQEAEREAKNILKYFNKFSKWNVSFHDFLRAHKTILKKKFNISYNGIYAKLQNPTLRLSVQNNVARDESEFREAHTFRLATRMLKNFNHILIVTGQGHLRGLKKLFDS